MAEEESHLDINRKWMDEAVAMLQPVTRGHYINEIDPVHYPQQIAECFSKESWKRLAILRKQHDPEGLFHTWLGQEEMSS
jgi:methylase of polypeptide subunit release factors